MRNDTALSSYLLAPTQEKEVVVYCSEESPKEERVGVMGPQQGCDEALKFTVSSMEMEINLQPLFWVYDHFLKCQPERVVEKGESCCRGAERERACAFPEYVCSVLR